jgi:hypothetical protein
MRKPPLGTGLRTALLFFAVGSITVTTWLWQLLYVRPDVGLTGAVAATLFPAAVGVVAGYYAIRG